MFLDKRHWQTIWPSDCGNYVSIINQALLPHKFEILKLFTLEEFYLAIKNMLVRGAPLIGVTAAYGIAFGIKENSSDEVLNNCFNYLNSSRPTAVNLKWALNRVLNKIKNLPLEKRFSVALEEANKIRNEDIEMCKSIGNHGSKLLLDIYQKKSFSNKRAKLNILTHCNAGWLATVDWGTALAPIYAIKRMGVDLHVWVDETRPRNQGGSLTSFELNGEKISNTIIVDNAGGYLMQKGLVDVVLVGSDRTTKKGDVCNKIGTYLKALAARDNNIPFFVALPTSTIDLEIENGLDEIEIEMRSTKEVSQITGLTNSGKFESVNLFPEKSNCLNPAFDVTPSKLVNALITEKGIIDSNYEGIKNLFL